MLHGRGRGAGEHSRSRAAARSPEVTISRAGSPESHLVSLQLHGRHREERTASCRPRCQVRAGRRGGGGGRHSRDRIVMLGFSQGACLATEFVIRNASRYGGMIAFSGGAIGPPGTRWATEGADGQTSGNFDGTPMFFGCSDVDRACSRGASERKCRDVRANGREGDDGGSTRAWAISSTTMRSPALRRYSTKSISR